MSTDSSGSSQCPVFFCGASTVSVGFDTFCSNAQKLASIGAQQIPLINQVAEKTKDLDHGVFVVLLGNKNDLVTVLNALMALKKRIDTGVVRVVVYSLVDHAKIPTVLKSKGCAETLNEGLTQKALVHKLQKHIQIVTTKFKTQKQDRTDDLNTLNKANARKTAADRTAEKPKLKFVAAVENENDCWLLKNKKDFKFIRGMWMGEMIGPGPSAGSWADAGGSGSQQIFQWKPRATGPDPFVPGSGAWYYSGRKPEFIWKTNRWRFVSEAPSLFFRAADAPAGTAGIFRFRFASNALEVALNSAVAKGKLKAIIQTFNDEKTFKDEKRKSADGKDLTLTEEKKARGDFNESLTPDDDPNEWGELEEGEEEQAADWNDETGDEDLDESPDWNGTDIGRGNKFNSGRGLGQGDGKGKKGYKHEDEFLGGPVEDKDFKTGADAFERITLNITLCRMDVAGTPVVEGVSLLERQDVDVLLDAPASGFKLGEKVSFNVLMAHSGKKKNLELNGTLKTSENQGDGREIILVSVAEASRGFLTEIQNVFDVRQEQLLRFLREAKGDVG